MMLRLSRQFLFGIVLPVALSACTNPPTEFMRAPALSPIGSGLTPTEAEQEANIALPVHPHAAGYTTSTDLYTDKRISHVGDIVTVIISINDKATFGNSTDRSTDRQDRLMMDFGVHAADERHRPRRRDARQA